MGSTDAGPRGVKRRALAVSEESLVEMRPLFEGGTLPLLIGPAVKGVDLPRWAAGRRALLESLLLTHGALLFRGFRVGTPEEFEQLIGAVCGSALEYRYRASPRSRVSGNIYTSTDYPADQSIFPHNEHGYSPNFPLKIFFYCQTPAREGGATPVGDCRRVHARISPEVRRRFVERGVLYVRNYNDGFGLPWQTVFQTSDRDAVEDYCRDNGLRCEWKEGERLRTYQVGPAVIPHPHTGEEVWFNHATFFNVSTLPPQTRDALSASFSAMDLPTNTFYGDGAPIEPAVLEELRAAYRQAMVSFPWEEGDVLLLDNMLTVHGREPFAGERKVLVGMADPHSYRRA